MARGRPPPPAPSSPNPTRCVRSITPGCAASCRLSPSSSDSTRHAAASGSSHDNVPSAIALDDVVAISRCQATFNRRDVAPSAGRRLASAHASSHIWNARYSSVRVYEAKKRRQPLGRAVAGCHRRFGLGQVGAGCLLERRGQHVVHRREVVVDQAARACPSRPRRREPSCWPSPLRGDDAQRRGDDLVSASAGAQAGHDATVTLIARMSNSRLRSRRWS